jgi:hypothetical protein
MHAASSAAAGVAIVPTAPTAAKETAVCRAAREATRKQGGIIGILA